VTATLSAQNSTASPAARQRRSTHQRARDHPRRALRGSPPHRARPQNPHRACPPHRPPRRSCRRASPPAARRARPLPTRPVRPRAPAARTVASARGERLLTAGSTETVVKPLRATTVSAGRARDRAHPCAPREPARNRRNGHDRRKPSTGYDGRGALCAPIIP
jgi:hypothetical protein